MIRNYYTLKKVCRDAQSLIGSYITESFTQDRDVLVLQCERGAKKAAIVINCSGSDASVYLKANFSRAKKNTLDIFDSIIGATINSIDMIHGERTLVIDIGTRKIIANIFGGSKSNIYIADSNSKITDSFRAKKEYIGKDLIIIISPKKNLSQFDKDETIAFALQRHASNIAKYYAEELLFRLEISGNKKLDEFTESELSDIESAIKDLVKELSNSYQYYIGLTKNKEMLFSLINLNAFEEIRGEYTDISQAILRRIVNKSQKNIFDVYYLDLHRKLSAKQKRLEQATKETDNTRLSFERAAKYKLWAETLLCGEDISEIGLESVSRELYDGETLQIALDKKLSVAENANKYFEKAKKTMESAKAREKLKVKLSGELNKLNSLFDRLSQTKTIEELDNIKSKMSEEANINSGDKSENTKKFREFDLGEGYILYVGKNAANNDELTVKFAKPNDIWLHARSVGGSHGVIRVNGDKKPAKKIIEKGAMIIAYYSQAKHGKYVPVSYTLKKYVNKPRGANPGSVTISREEVVMVEPKLWTEEL